MQNVKWKHKSVSKISTLITFWFWYLEAEQKILQDFCRCSIVRYPPYQIAPGCHFVRGYLKTPHRFKTTHPSCSGSYCHTFPWLFQFFETSTPLSYTFKLELLTICSSLRAVFRSYSMKNTCFFATFRMNNKKALFSDHNRFVLKKATG